MQLRDISKDVDNINENITKLEEDLSNVKHDHTRKALEYLIQMKKANIKRLQRWNKETE